jgi:hypothetical protein
MLERSAITTATFGPKKKQTSSYASEVCRETRVIIFLSFPAFLPAPGSIANNDLHGMLADSQRETI